MREAQRLDKGKTLHKIEESYRCAKQASEEQSAGTRKPGIRLGGDERSRTADVLVAN